MIERKELLIQLMQMRDLDELRLIQSAIRDRIKEVSSAIKYDLDKGDIVIKGKELNVNYGSTWTCYKGKEKACGKCGSCVERLEAFGKAEIKDPVEYE